MTDLTAITKRVPLESIHHDPSNARSHPERNLAEIEHSLAHFGQVEPLVVQKSTGKVIGGNGRLTAMKKLGWKECSIVELDVDNAQATALGIALNRTADLAEWDNETLATLLESLRQDDALDLTGFDSDELDALLEELTPKEVTEDEAPEPPANPVSRTGDLWLLGEHRVLCGDSTVKGDVERLGKRFDLCFTDPPYGADIKYAGHKDTQDALVGLVAGFLPIAQQMCDLVALTPGINNVFLYPKPSWILCWFYGAGTGRSPWGFTAWQPVMVWGNCPKLANGEGCHPDGFQWMMSRDDAAQSKETGHACPKPVSVWARFMDRLSSKTTSSVYDPFLGSGTTLIAAEQLGRRCYGIEISPQYVDVIVTRWQNLTGQSATLDGDGRSFSDIKSSRG